MSIIKRIIGKIFHIFYINVSRFLPTHGKILMLHWVSDEIQNEETEYYRISTEQCKKLFTWLKQKNIISLERWEEENDFYALTIDDVPENFYKNAYPILKEMGIPFTIFVNVSLLDKEGFISKDNLIEMAQCELCTIGSHGINHGEYASLTKEQAIKELEDSQKELESIIGKPVELFAYPYGSYYACGYSNKHLACKVYKYAFGTVASPIPNPSIFKNYYLPRINIDKDFINKL